MIEKNDTDEPDRTDSDSALFAPIETVERDVSRPFTVPRPPCDACETNRHDGLDDVSLGDYGYEVCSECLAFLQDEIERYYWWDRLTEAHYNRSVEYLQELDEVWCVKGGAYQGGELWVHTPFCDAGVVNDVCDHFGFRIRWFSIVQPGEHEFDCLHDHGPCIEINLDYNNRVPTPLPIEYDIGEDRTYSDTEWVEPHQKLFDREE